MNTLVFILAVIGATAIIVGLAYAVVYAFNRKSILSKELYLISEIEVAVNEYDFMLKRIEEYREMPMEMVDIGGLKKLVTSSENTFKRVSHHAATKSNDTISVLRARMKLTEKGEAAHKAMSQLMLGYYLKVVNYPSKN